MSQNSTATAPAPDTGAAAGSAFAGEGAFAGRRWLDHERIVVGADAMEMDSSTGGAPTETAAAGGFVDSRGGLVRVSRTQHWSTECVRRENGRVEARPVRQEVEYRTQVAVPRVGLMLVGLGGNNGTTLASALLANRHKLRWETKDGVQEPNWFGSVAMTGTTKLGQDRVSGEDFYVPYRSLVPLLHPDDLVLGGWDISSADMVEAVKRARVVDIALQKQLAPYLEEIEVLPGVYDPDFIASNQQLRADHLLPQTGRAAQVEALRAQIRNFRAAKKLDKVIVLWTANTERMSEHRAGVHDSEEGLRAALLRDEPELAPSLLYAIAAVEEGCAYINGSPQNTFCRGLEELARRRGVLLAGDDLKTGQTKLKSVLADYLVATGLKLTSVVSYNHLGNNDGLNLSSAAQFRSKEISKASVIDDLISSNPILYPSAADKPDHLIVIKYVPAVGDSKRAMDEYTAKICLNGTQTLVIHNTCEDSLLAAPIILDLVIFMEFIQRVTVSLTTVPPSGDKLHTLPPQFGPLTSLLSLFLKAPAVPSHAPVVNALFAQKEALTQFLRATAGLPPTDYLTPMHRLDISSVETTKMQ